MLQAPWNLWLAPCGRIRREQRSAPYGAAKCQASGSPDTGHSRTAANGGVQRVGGHTNRNGSEFLPTSSCARSANALSPQALEGYRAPPWLARPLGSATFTFVRLSPRLGP